MVLKRFRNPCAPWMLYRGPNGLAFDGTNLYFVDAFTSNTIYILSTAGATITSYAAPGAIGTLGIDALGFGDTSSFGSTLFASDFSTDTVFLLDPLLGTTFTSYITSFDLGGGMDLNTSTGTLWATDSSATTIYEMDSETGTVLDSFAGPSASFGLGFVGSRLYVSQGTFDSQETAPGTIGEFNASTGAVLNTFASPDVQPSALAGTPVPEPSSMILFGTGLAALLGIARRQRKNVH